MAKFCKKCEKETERDKLDRCRLCLAVNSAAYRKAHPSRIKEISARYYAGHKEEQKTKSAKYREDNPEKYKETKARCRKKTAEKIREYNALYWHKNKEKEKARKKKWVECNVNYVKRYRAKYAIEHPEIKRISEHNRRAKKQNNGGKLSSGLTVKLYRLQCGKCACCGVPLGDDYHLDHIMPLALGGVNEDWNMQLLTSTCNQQKHAKHPVDFMRQRGFLL